MLRRGEKPCRDGGARAASQASTSWRARGAGSAGFSGGGGKIPAPWLRGLPPRQRPVGTAGTRGTRGKQPGFPCPTGTSPDRPKPSPHLGILRHAGAEKRLRTPKKIENQGTVESPQLALGLLGGNEANLLINWD